MNSKIDWNHFSQLAAQIDFGRGVSEASTPDAFRTTLEFTWDKRLMASVPPAGRSRAAWVLAGLFVTMERILGRSELAAEIVSPSVADGHQVPIAAQVLRELEYSRLASHLDDLLAAAQVSDLPKSPQRPSIRLAIDSSLAARKSAAAELDIALRILESKLIFEVEGSSVNDEMLTRLLRCWNQVLQQSCQGPTMIADVEVLTAQERHQLLESFNSTDTEYVQKTFHGLLEAQVDRVPNSPAVLDERDQLTYAELDARANQLAQLLLERGLETNDVVGIVMKRSVDFFVAMFGIMKAGGAYLPIEPTFPRERRDYMLEHSRCRLVLVDADEPASIPEAMQAIQTSASALESYPSARPNVPVGQDDLAYVIYTSGSTGEPKGVAIHHDGVANLHNIHRHRFGITEHDRMLEFASFSFDTSVWEIIMCLLSGASLHIVSDALKANYKRLEQYIADHRITVATFPPTYLAYTSPEAVPSMRKVIVAGSECSVKLLTTWNRHVDFHNAYGPTEHSVCVAVFDAPKGATFDRARVPIGKPLFNKRIYIVDAHGKLAPKGTPGELWASGVGTSRGYLGRPELTRDKFIANPFPVALDNERAKAHSRVYKTGDLARWTEDGNIEFLGRIDNQVKIRGYRVELDEVDAALLEIPEVVGAGSVVHTDASGQYTLWGFYCAPPALDANTLRRKLSAKIPEFMIPSQLERVDSLPMTNSDKVDRKALGQRIVQAVENQAPQSHGDDVAQGGHADPVALLQQMLAAVSEGRISPACVQPDSELASLGVDSLQFMKIVVGLEAEYGIEFDEDFLIDGRNMTPTQIAALVRSGGTP